MENMDSLLDFSYQDKHYGQFGVPGISVSMVVHNCIFYGHPFIEAIQTIMPLADEVVVLDIHSVDGTSEIMEKLVKKYDKIKYIKLPFVIPTTVGKPGWGTWHRIGFDLCRYNFILMVQADEIFSKELVDEVINWKKCLKWGLEFQVKNIAYKGANLKYKHMVDNFTALHPNPYYVEATRMMCNDLGTTVEGDGWRYIRPGDPNANKFYTFNNYIYHVCSSCFSVNEVRRHLIRGYFYGWQEALDIAHRGWGKNQEPLAKIEIRHPVSGIPEIIKPLIGYNKYFVREDLLNV